MSEKALLTTLVGFNTVGNMVLFRRIFLFFVSFFILSSCSIGGAQYPKKLMGRRVIFETTIVENVKKRSGLHDIYIYKFHTEGTYEGTLNGKLSEEGTYTYHFDPSSKDALLNLNYSAHGKPFSYTVVMKYTTSSSGGWLVSQSTDPKMKTEEKGTFTVVKRGEDVTS